MSHLTSRTIGRDFKTLHWDTHLATGFTGCPEAACTVKDAEMGRRGISRRLVLTANAILERRPSTYEVAERRQMAGLAAVVRFVDEPQWLSLEWADGSASSVYMSTARDALLATLLDAAQVCNAHLTSCAHHHVEVLWIDSGLI